MALADGIVYAVVPAAIGAGAATIQLLGAARRLHLDEQGRARLMLFAALPLTGVILALVGALQAADAPRDLRLQLMVLGGAAFLQTSLQGLLAARAFPGVNADPTRLGRALIPLALTETIVLPPFAWIMMLAARPVM